MHPDLIKRYENKILPNIEEPIRALVKELWVLPFVVDTTETCSGHIVTSNWGKSRAEYAPLRRGLNPLYWYPHGIRLGISFSLESRAEEFIAKFKELGKSIDIRGSESERNYRGIEGTLQRVKHGFYDSNFPENSFSSQVENPFEYIDQVHEELSAFWDNVAVLIKEFNPGGRISSARGKNFLKIINWADLGDPRRYRVDDL